MPLPKSCSTALLIVLPPGEAPELRRLFALLRSRPGSAASWVLASGDLERLSPEDRKELAGRLTDGDDDLILQGYAGAPLAVLGDEELRVELEEAGRHARKLLALPEGRLRPILAPVEAVPGRRSEGVALIIGLGSGDHDGASDAAPTRRGDDYLWIAGADGYQRLPALRLSALSRISAVKRYRLLRRLDRAEHSTLILDVGDRAALEALETILPALAATPLSLPTAWSHEQVPERLEPLTRRARSPLWHARLLSLSARRRHSTRGRVSPRILQPFLLPPEELGRSSVGKAPLFEHRVVHASMLGSARMEEGDLTVQFMDGMVRGLRRAESPAAVPSTDPETPPDRARRNEPASRAGSPTQSLGAFSFDWDTIRGLTTRTLVSAGDREPKSRRRRGGADGPEAPRMLVDADYLFLDELPWLVVRAMAHYPRRSDAQSGETQSLEDKPPPRIRPLPITLGSIRPKSPGTVAIRGRRHDGGVWEKSYLAGRDSSILPVPGQRLELEIEDRLVQILFLDEGHGLTWEAALECTPLGDGWEIALLPFGEFELRDEGVSTASILLALTIGERSDSPESIRKRVLRVLPSPATETAAVDTGAWTTGV